MDKSAALNKKAFGYWEKAYYTLSTALVRLAQDKHDAVVAVSAILVWHFLIDTYMTEIPSFILDSTQTNGSMVRDWATLMQGIPMVRPPCASFYDTTVESEFRISIVFGCGPS